MKKIVGIIIPCYKASGLINSVISRIIKTTNKLSDLIELKIYLINDCCPQNCWKEVNSEFKINLINHAKNKGVGVASTTGFNAALKDNCSAIIKIDADMQHSPEYLLELIPFMTTLPKNQLYMIKGSRYHFQIKNNKVPFTRRIGSLLMEPIARVALNYRGLSDITNGYIATNDMTLKYLLSKNIGKNFCDRYLFESSFLEKICTFQCEIYQFPIAAIYGKKWRSSMQSWKMALPISTFWLKAVSRRIYNNYLNNLNLGSFLLLIFAFTLIFVIYILNVNIIPYIKSGIFVSAGIAATFTSMLTISLICLLLFFFYDYTSSKKVKNINFKYFLKDIEI